MRETFEGGPRLSCDNYYLRQRSIMQIPNPNQISHQNQPVWGGGLSALITKWPWEAAKKQLWAINLANKSSISAASQLWLKEWRWKGRSCVIYNSWQHSFSSTHEEEDEELRNEVELQQKLIWGSIVVVVVRNNKQLNLMALLLLLLATDDVVEKLFSKLIASIQRLRRESITRRWYLWTNPPPKWFALTTTIMILSS